MIYIIYILPITDTSESSHQTRIPRRVVAINMDSHAETAIRIRPTNREKCKRNNGSGEGRPDDAKPAAVGKLLVLTIRRPPFGQLAPAEV